MTVVQWFARVASREMHDCFIRDLPWLRIVVGKMEFIYTGIRVRNLRRSIQFYTETMGMKEVGRGKMQAGGTYVELKSEGSDQLLELNYYPPGSRFFEEYVEGSELDHLAFSCDNVRRSYDKALAGGATSAVEPWDERGSTLAFVRDPDGVWIELHSKATESASRLRKRDKLARKMIDGPKGHQTRRARGGKKQKRR